MQVQFLGWEDALEKEMATHSRILACEIPWTEEPGRLQSMAWGHRESDMTEQFSRVLSAAAFFNTVSAHSSEASSCCGR